MKVSIIVVLYNGKKYIKPVFDAIFAQTYKNFEVIAVICSHDGSMEEIQQGYPAAKIIDAGGNIGFAAGNNFGIRESSGELIQLVNQDLVLEPDYIEKMAAEFDHDHQAGAATGKLLRFDFDKKEKSKIIDSTGVVMSASGRARDRGQNQIDSGQFDAQKKVFAVSGAAPMYRRQALDEVQYCEYYKCEYFDEDFFMYWEDVDLSWRLNHAGYKNVYVPEAVGFHGRTAGQAKGGYLHFWNFIRHHRGLSEQVRRWNYKNHILMYLKNTNYIHPLFVLRELAMLVFIMMFETRTLGVIPELFRQIPRMRRKRRFIFDK